MKILDYLKFTDQKISGFSYMLISGVISSLVIQFSPYFVLPGLWPLAAAAYKRSGEFDWPLRGRVITTVLVSLSLVILGVVRMYPEDEKSFEMLQYLGLPAIILHTVLIFKNSSEENS